MRYFKKPNGKIVEYDPKTHNLDSFKERFVEVDKNGNKKKPKPVKKEDG
tara:strand:- start:369 stop:515 length:147 start_codon:yes stop_codon:yes gene_type:complete